PKKEHTISVKTHHMNCDYSGYEGRKVIGKTETVILRGEIAIENNECLLKAGHGQFIPRTTTSKTVI
ncbi:MAG: dihydropyrimidinase, partial [Zetaproteobacteria bacterium]|nr:dihydropyrimidinase [Flavobacteriales bacterium]